jgi:F-type H+-transporting ATPase subunit a
MLSPQRKAFLGMLHREMKACFSVLQTWRKAFLGMLPPWRKVLKGRRDVHPWVSLGKTKAWAVRCLCLGEKNVTWTSLPRKGEVAHPGGWWVRVIRMSMMYSPLEQFRIVRVLPLGVGAYDVSLTNSSLYMLLATGLSLLLFLAVTREGGRVIPSSWQSLVEMVYDFVVSLVEEQIGPAGRRYFPLIFTLFTFLLATNLMGMIPYSFTATSHMVVTFGLSVSLFLGITIVGFQRHGLHFFSFLLPKGAPLMLAPLLVVLELVSYSFRAISLGVRLFANMMAGHTLVKILSGFAWTMLSLGGMLSVAASIPCVIVFALTGLEIGVACLQAYVFTILVCIYLHDAIHLH